MTDWKQLTLFILSAFKKRNQKKLRKLNDQALKELALEFKKPLFEIAIMSYILSKIVSKPRFLRKENEKKMEAIEKRFEYIAAIIDTGEEDVGALFEKINEAIHELEKEDARFITDLITKGRLKVGATVYAQGLSLGSASAMTGIDKQEILDYVGKTMMFDRVKEEKSVLERLKTVRHLIKT